MTLGEELFLRLIKIEADGNDWEIRSRNRPNVYVRVFIPRTARRDEVMQRFAFAISDALEQTARNV